MTRKSVSKTLHSACTNASLQIRLRTPLASINVQSFGVPFSMRMSHLLHSNHNLSATMASHCYYHTTRMLMNVESNQNSKESKDKIDPKDRIEDQSELGDEKSESRLQKLKHRIENRLEDVQERVEERLPEKYEHLKQQEGESNTEHRRRLFDRLTEKVKDFVKKYGILGVVLYFAIYFANIGLFFVLLESGIFKKDDAIQRLKDWGMDKHFDLDKLLSGKKTSFAIAWILTKVTEPLRMMITITTVPYLYRGLVAARILKGVTAKVVTKP